VKGADPLTAKGIPGAAKQMQLGNRIARVDYNPCLATWNYHGELFQKAGPYTVRICDNLGFKKRYHERCEEPEVFTITIPDGFDRTAANSIVALVQHAPQIWRMARDMLRFKIIESAELDEWGKLAALLSIAGEKRPFDPPDDADGEDFDKDRIARDLELLDERWRALMNHPAIRTEPESRRGQHHQPIYDPRFFCAHCGCMEMVPSKMADHLSEAHGICLQDQPERINLGDE